MARGARLGQRRGPALLGILSERVDARVVDDARGGLEVDGEAPVRGGGGVAVEDGAFKASLGEVRGEVSEGTPAGKSGWFSRESRVVGRRLSAIGESRVRVRGDRGPARNVRSGRGRGAHLHPGNAVVARGGHLLPSGVRRAGAEVGSILRAAKSPESISKRPCLAETVLGGARVRGSGADGEAQEQHDPRKGHPGRAPGRVGRTPFPRAVVWGKRSTSPTLRTFRVLDNFWKISRNTF